MGWKASMIIVSKPAPVDLRSLLGELGFSNLTKIEDEPVEVAINPRDNQVFIGSYKGNLLICALNFPMDFFYTYESHTEKILINTFPGCEICSIVLHSSINLWAYSITKNGQKIRVRAGRADEGTYIDLGEPLEEEKELLSRSTIDEDGARTYILEEFGGKPMSEDQVGENFVFAICKRYFGEELDQADELLETELTGYSFGQQPIPKPTVYKSRLEELSKQDKPWWKFW